MYTLPTALRRHPINFSRLGAWLSLSWVVAALGACKGTDCAQESWDTAVEAPISFGTQPQARMRIKADISEELGEMVIRTTPAVEIGEVTPAPPTPETGSAATASSNGIPSSAPSSSLLPTPSNSALTPLASGSATSGAIPAPQVKQQPDGSTLIVCGSSNCQALEFTLSPKSDGPKPDNVRVHVTITGTTNDCGETAPSSLHVELKALTH
jgi:hypothetical protein